MRALLDALLARFARLLLGLFFRDVEVARLDRLPRDRPLLLVANHPNGLVDPLLVLGTLPLRPHVLGRSTLWHNPALRPLFTLAGVVPVYRRQDAASDMARNAETFARCHQVLARGGTILLFPEGRSHSERGLLPLRTGAARIALEAEARFGPLGVRIVPLGLTYDAKDRFRSRARLEVGEPLDPRLEIERARDQAFAPARALTERTARALVAAVHTVPARATRPFRAAEPLAAAATLLNGVPAVLAAAVARRTTARREMRATYTLLAALYLFPLWWLGAAVLVAWRSGLWPGLAVGLAAPLTGWAATRLGAFDVARVPPRAAERPRAA